MALHARIGLGKEICGAINAPLPAVKDGRIEMERRGVELARLVDVADIGCPKVQMAQDERSFRVVVDIGNTGIVDFQGVYFERINVSQRLLPAALLE